MLEFVDNCCVVQTPEQRTVMLFLAEAAIQHDHIVALPYIRGGGIGSIRVHVAHSPDHLPAEKPNQTHRVAVDSHIVQVEGLVAGVLAPSSVAVGHLVTERALLRRIDAMIRGRQIQEVLAT